LAVLDNRDDKKFVGLLTMSDIVRAHAEAAISAADPAVKEKAATEMK